MSEDVETPDSLRIRIPARYSPPKTRVGVKRCALRDALKTHSKWVGGVDPMNIMICLAIVAAPVIGAGLILIALVAVVLVLGVILW
jgi:hypothetical protein